MKVVALLVSRLGSTRLPRKALMDLNGKPMIERLADRVLKAKQLDHVAVATTTLPEDAELCAWAASRGLGSFRGSPENVSLRMAQAAEALNADVVVELLVDNPLIDPQTIDAVVSLLKERGLDYAATVTTEYPNEKARAPFPLGVRVQAYTRKTAAAWKDHPDHFESKLGTTSFIYMNPALFKLGFIEAAGPWSACRHPEWNFAVNYASNHDLVAKIMSTLGPDAPLPSICAWMDRHPDAAAMMSGR